MKGEGNTGHRERVFQKIIKKSEMSDYELLEAVLFSVFKRIDTKPLAKKILAHFRSFRGILLASYEELLGIPGVGDSCARFIVLLGRIYEYVLHESIQTQPIISSTSSLLDYCRIQMGSLQVEQVRVLYLDSRNMLLRNDLISTGTVTSAYIYPREIIKNALIVGASSMILVHNHPSNNLNPSEEDIAVSKLIANISKQLQIKLIDHIIIGKDDYFSLKSAGLF